MKEPATSPRVVRDLPLTRLLPNMLTVLSLCAGLTGIRFALMERWQDAVYAIIIAGVFDMLDGRVARMLSMASKFGAELDSLSDAISFGVAPGLIVYEWSLKSSEQIGWIAVLVYAVCMALRLARFNTMLDDHTAPAWSKRFFTGVPAPAGAGLALLPIMVSEASQEMIQFPAFLIVIWLIFVGSLLVSRLPTLSLKGWRVSQSWIAPMFAGAGLMIAALITHTWLTLVGVALTYILSLPIGYYSYRRKLKSEG